MNTGPNPIADAVAAHTRITLDSRSEPHPMTTQPEDPFDVHAAIASDLRSNHLAKTLLSQRLGTGLSGDQAATVLALVRTLESQNHADAQAQHLVQQGIVTRDEADRWVRETEGLPARDEIADRQAALQQQVVEDGYRDVQPTMTDLPA